MAHSLLISNLRFNETDYGWALDVGSFLAAWNTAFRGLLSANSDERRHQILEHMRKYAYNIQRRLVAHEVALEPRMLQPPDLQRLEATMIEVTTRLRKMSSKHCAFMLLGSATTFIELGMKPGMPVEYYGPLRVSADSAIIQLHALCQKDFPPEIRPDAIRTDLLRLGKLDNVRSVLRAGQAVHSKSMSAPRQAENFTYKQANEARGDKRRPSIAAVETQLPQLLATIDI